MFIVIFSSYFSAESLPTTWICMIIHPFSYITAKIPPWILKCRFTPVLGPLSKLTNPHVTGTPSFLIYASNVDTFTMTFLFPSWFGTCKMSGIIQFIALKWKTFLKPLLVHFSLSLLWVSHLSPRLPPLPPLPPSHSQVYFSSMQVRCFNLAVFVPTLSSWRNDSWTATRPKAHWLSDPASY